MFATLLWCAVLIVLPQVVPSFYIDGVSRFAIDVLNFHKDACSSATTVSFKSNVVIFIFRQLNSLTGLCSPKFTSLIGVFLMPLIGALLTSVVSKRKKIFGLISFMIIMSLPSVVNWYLFIHKELFIFFGFSLIFYSIFNIKLNFKKIGILLLMLGVALVLITKFYYFYYLLFFSLSVILLSIKLKNKRMVNKSIVLFLIVLLGTFFGKSNNFYNRGDFVASKMQNQKLELVYNKANFDYLTSRPLYARSYYLAKQSGDSDVDRNLYFSNYLDLLNYIPRLVYLSFSYPMPIFKNFNLSIESVLISFQTLTILMGVVGCIVGILRKAVYIYSLPLLIIVTIICLSIPNTGSYYRYRDPYLFFILFLGFIELLSMFDFVLRRRNV